MVTSKTLSSDSSKIRLIRLKVAPVGEQHLEPGVGRKINARAGHKGILGERDIP